MRIRSILAILLVGLFTLSACTQTANTPLPEVTVPPPNETSEQPEPTQLPPTATPEPFQVPEHEIGIRIQDGIGEFYHMRTGERFVPRGVNYVWLEGPDGSWSNTPLRVGIFDPAKVSEIFGRLHDLGYNTVRAFIDACSSGYGCITENSEPGLNPTFLSNLVEMMDLARENDIFLLLTSNDLPEGGGYWQISDRGTDDFFAPYRNTVYLTDPGVTATEAYWQDLMEGLIAQEADFSAVLGWQLLNEQWMFALQPPLSLESGVVTTANGQQYDLADPLQKRQMVGDGILHYISRTASVIKTYDPSALVTMGFFAPDFPNETSIGGDWYVDTAYLIENNAELDFYDFHAYPGSDISLEKIAENFGMNGFEQKPVVMGEYGAFKHTYDSLDQAARALSRWVESSCDLGFDGWLYWTYDPAPDYIGDTTWGFTDQEDYLMELFAPQNQPDPCRGVDLPNQNLAYGKTVRVSNQLPEEPAEYAVDEDTGTQWGSGGDAVQWIEVDLGQPYPIAAVRLAVAQWPAGDTVHRIYGRGQSGGEVLLHEFSQETDQGDWLTFTAEPAVEGIRYLRVETIASPSWVSWSEIQVFSEPLP